MSDTTQSDELRGTVISLYNDTFSKQNDGLTAPALSDDTVLLDTGLDSLGFAILVTRLEDDLGYDPFSLSENAYYPRTFGEFVKFYRDNRPT